ncbi:DUF4268 domain-containing protein [uncultured Hymenobacter sp.]|uniref:DUF4268 domain-containing protein n=1 Tax=uncultured Hymenobacter sp. TaxID=170016 RepID=UPI0035C9DB43
MYSQAEASRLRQEFWTAFGQYMRPVPPAEGGSVNWTNYKTGLKGVFFRLHADARSARISIELTQADADVRALFFEQFEALKTLLHETLGEEWTWQADATDAHGQPLSGIYQELRPANVFARESWPALISFFKPRLVALDAFWADAQYAFEELRQL